MRRAYLTFQNGNVVCPECGTECRCPGGCIACWSCPECGCSGCANLAGYTLEHLKEWDGKHSYRSSSDTDITITYPIIEQGDGVIWP